jgi:hypothetical protein
MSAGVLIWRHEHFGSFAIFAAICSSLRAFGTKPLQSSDACNATAQTFMQDR